MPRTSSLRLVPMNGCSCGTAVPSLAAVARSLGRLVEASRAATASMAPLAVRPLERSRVTRAGSASSGGTNRAPSRPRLLEVVCPCTSPPPNGSLLTSPPPLDPGRPLAPAVPAGAAVPACPPAAACGMWPGVARPARLGSPTTGPRPLAAASVASALCTRRWTSCRISRHEPGWPPVSATTRPPPPPARRRVARATRLPGRSLTGPRGTWRTARRPLRLLREQWHDHEEDQEQQAEDLFEPDLHPWSLPSSAARPMLPLILVSDWMFWIW